MREQKYSRNITLKARNIETIEGYMNKSRRNFSQTINIIIEQWDRFSIEMLRMQRTEKVKGLTEAKVIKE